MTERDEALLVLSDGTVFEGEAAGALGKVEVATGELVFNTALSGYQEVITDPSYAGQVIAFTYPHIGNYGTTGHDNEARRPFCNGIVTRDLVAVGSNWRSEEGFEDFLVRTGVPAITGVDTRRLTRHVREAGALPCAMGTTGRRRAAQGGRRGAFDHRARPGQRGDDRRSRSPAGTARRGWSCSTSG